MVKMLIQVEAGSGDRRVYNEKTLEYKETLAGSQIYPYAYGFIIGTSADDGDCVDCYLISKEKITAGSIIDCEPAALLEQHEDDEIDHKVLAVLPDADVHVDQSILQELQTFILEIFSDYPEMNVRVGPVHSREAALQHIQKFR